MKTILITGCSSGFGLETARYFLERGWNVLATMRTPSPDLLPASERLRILPLDIADPESIRRLAEVGPIDVLVNNAGVGLLSIFQGTPMAKVRAIFETNLFGAMALTQAFLPGMVARRSGTIVNISSSTTLAPAAMLSVYSASKTALNMFTESLALELKPFNVHMRLVIPGRSPTPFGRNAMALAEKDGVRVPDVYAEFAQGVFARVLAPHTGSFTRPLDVAEAVWFAANDPSSPIRLPAGADAIELARGGRPR